MKKNVILLLLAAVLTSCAERVYDTTVQTWNLWSDSTMAPTANGLLGYAPTDSLVAAYSNELQVTPATPRAFIALSGDDGLVPIANSLRYYQSLQLASVPAELHMYPTEGHGWGFNPTPFHDVLLQHMLDWINGD